jgi:hypothetical protein
MSIYDRDYMKSETAGRRAYARPRQKRKPAWWKRVVFRVWVAIRRVFT